MSDPAWIATLPASPVTSALDTQCRVLVFHEDRESRPYHLASLDSCGLRNRDVAGSVTEAIKLLISTHYDLVMVTCGDLEERAEQFIEEIKSLESTATIPLIAIASDGRPKQILRIRSKGVDRILTPPLSRKIVQETLERLINPSGHGRVTSVLLRQAQDCLAADQLDDAERLFQDVLQLDETHIEAWIGLADIRLQRNETRSAADLLKKSMADAKLLADPVEQQRLLAMVYTRLGNYFAETSNYPQALRHYQAALRINPFDPATLPRLLRVMAKFGSLEDILALVEEIRGNYAPFSKSLDQFAGALADLTGLYTAMNLRQNVDTLYDLLLGIQHNDAAIHLRVVDHLLKEHRFASARQHLEASLVRLKDVDLLTRLADLHLQVRRARRLRDGLTESAQILLTDFARDEDTWLVERSIRLYQDALMLEPYGTALWMNLLRCHLWRDDRAAVLDLLERLAGAMELEEELLAEIAGTLIDEGACDLALPYARDGIARYPESSRFHLLEARLHNAEGEHYKAVTTLKRGLLHHPNDPRCLTELAATYGAMGHWGDAIEFYEQARRLCPEDPAIAENLRQALRAKYAS